MEIRGNSYQEKEPSPEEPVEIKHSNTLFGNIEGQPIKISYNPQKERLKDFIKINGKWCARFDPIEKE